MLHGNCFSYPAVFGTTLVTCKVQRSDSEGQEAVRQPGLPQAETEWVCTNCSPTSWPQSGSTSLFLNLSRVDSVAPTHTSAFLLQQEGTPTATTALRPYQRSTPPTLPATPWTTTAGPTPASRTTLYQSVTSPPRWRFLRRINPCTSTLPSTSTRSVLGLQSLFAVPILFLTSTCLPLVSGTSVSGTPSGYKKRPFFFLLLICLR